MTHTSLLIVNVNSGSFAEDRCDALTDALDAAGLPCRRLVRFPDDDLPDRAALEVDGIDVLAVYTGDGTINTLNRRLAGWGGRMLVLPGGTLNLLSKRLHGDRGWEAIVADATSAPTVHPPVVRGEGVEALVGVILGPTTSWGKVREHMRHLDVKGLVEAVPQAVTDTFQGTGVHLADSTDRYPAINLTPKRDRLEVTGFLADHASHVLQHGFAWLGGDFRDGPHDVLGDFPDVTILGEETIGMMYDGERGEVESGARFTSGRAELAYVATRRDDQGSGG